MENTVTMHVIYRLHELVHVVLDALLWQIVPAALDGIVHVHFHELENEGETTGWLVIQHLVQLNDLRMG